MSEYTDILLWASALARSEPHAERIWAITGTAHGPLEPPDLELHFPVACVAVPGLCIGAACRWALRGAGHLPPCLQALMDSDSVEAGRPLRGACLAFRGKALLLTDERDDPLQQRYSLLHEAAHFFLHHAFPREDALRRLGPRIRDVLDGKRDTERGERFDAVLRRADLDFHTHLYPRNASGRTEAEAEADTLACLLLCPLSPGAPVPLAATLEKAGGLPAPIAALYRDAWQHRQAPPPRHPFLLRLGR